MKKRSIYFTDQELKDLFYAESLASHGCEEGDSEEYQEAMQKLFLEMQRRKLID